MLSELHNEHTVEVTSKFHHAGFNSYYNSPQFNSFTNKTNGGEVIATKSNINSQTIDMDFLQHVASESHQPLAFSASYLRLKGLTIVLCSVYLYHTEGLTARNAAIMFQLTMLRQIINMPMIINGDYNMPSQVLVDAQWVSRLGGKVMQLDINSTLTTAATSNIDYIIATDNANLLINQLTAVTDTPWSPHIGRHLNLTCQPTLIQGRVHCQPRPLPMFDFNQSWNLMDTNIQNGSWLVAKK